MELEQFIIDAFTAEPFKGNPAAVVPVEAQVAIFGRSGRGEIGYYGPPE